MRVDPRHLGLVLAIVKHGTFNRAAEALGMSQPALSKSIALLERRLGEKIFERGARGSTLTEAGTIIARSAENVEQLISRVKQEIDAKAHRSQGPLWVGATPSMMLGIIPEAVTRLVKSGHHLNLSLVEDLDDKLTAALLHGKIDLLVGPVAGLHPGPAEIIEEALAEEPFQIGVPVGHPLAGKKSLKLADLIDEAWVLPAPGSSFYRTVEAMFIATGTPWPQNVIATNSLVALERLVATAGGIAILTPAQLFTRPSSIIAIPVEGAPVRAIGVRRLKGIRLPALADLFLAELRQIFDALGRRSSSLG